MKKISLIIVLVLAMSLLLMACASTVPNGEETKPPPSGDLPSTEGENTSPEVESPEAKPEEDKPHEVIPPTPIKKYDRIAIARGDVNIRSGKGTKYKVVGRLKRGEGVALVDEVQDSWYKVHYMGKYAYISSSYVNIITIEKTDNNSIERVVEEGKRLMGYPYVWGSQRYHFGNGIKNKNFEMGKFDCSALTQYIYHKGARVNIGVTTRHQVQDGRLVRDSVKRGDLMFFTNASRKHKKGIERVGHVAMYLGDNYILHTADKYAVIEEISATRWLHYLVSKRFVD